MWRLVGDGSESPRHEPNAGPSSALGGSQPTKTTPSPPIIPDTRPALPDTDVAEDGRDQPQLFKEDLEASLERLTAVRKPPASLPIPQPVAQDRKRGGSQKGVLEPRRFHLSRKTLSKSSPQSPSGHGVRKHRRNDLAVFVEKAKKLLNISGAKQTTGTGAKESPTPQPAKGFLNDFEPNQKRPNASAAERVWRAENWSKPVNTERSEEMIKKSGNSIDEPSDTWNYDSMELAEQLQQIALEEIQAQGQETSSLNRNHGKIKPKAPKPRQSKAQIQSDSEVEGQDKEDSSHSEDDDDYVFDTYVRSSAQPTGISESTLPYVDALKNMDQGHVGILVIEEDEESLWETFGENQESDPEWNSEEEDENGMCRPTFPENYIMKGALT